MTMQAAIHQDTCECLEWDAEDFTCARCDKLYGSCYGAADRHPDLCDFCFAVAEEGREEVVFPKAARRQRSKSRKKRHIPGWEDSHRGHC